MKGAFRITPRSVTMVMSIIQERVLDSVSARVSYNDSGIGKSEQADYFSKRTMSLPR